LFVDHGDGRVVRLLVEHVPRAIVDLLLFQRHPLRLTILPAPDRLIEEIFANPILGVAAERTSIVDPIDADDALAPSAVVAGDRVAPGRPDLERQVAGRRGGAFVTVGDGGAASDAEHAAKADDDPSGPRPTPDRHDSSP
jgi:hypothetical protein